MKRKRILVVDDEISFTRLLKLNLEQTDQYEVRVENRAEAAVSTARGFRPDLILLDIMMPGMVGGDVAARFHADAHLNSTPIVFFSAAVGGNWAMEYGDAIRGLPFIAKPASVEDVLQGIEQQLTKVPLRDNGIPTGQEVAPGLDAGLRQWTGETESLAS
jgi:CheY-like chemotaxis protein